MKLRNFSFAVLVACAAMSSGAIAQNAVQEIAKTSFKSVEIKQDYESYLWRLGDILSGLTYGATGDEAKDLVLVCGYYSGSKNYQDFPKWANVGVSNMCKYAKTMEALLAKDKRPIGKAHCKDLANAIKSFEDNANSPYYLETKKWSDHVLYYMKKMHKTTFTHSWTGGWFGPDSYEYSCD